MESNNWAIGDSLVVKPGVTDPATGIALSGWQGRLIALEDAGDRLSIQWDSLTLKSMPPAYIVECEEWGVPWSAMRLSAHDVLLTAARDSEEDVTATMAALETQYSWLSLGEQGRRIQQIVNRAEAHDLLTSFRTWHAYLEEHLVVPFVATVVADQRGPVHLGDQVTVTGILFLDETWGTIVKVRQKRRVYHLPLCDLRATNGTAESQQLIQDYAVWFTRRSLVSARLLRLS
jgi:hypothetical protein